MKNPIVAAIANAVLPGLGYLLIQRRVLFGALLTVGSVAGWALVIVYPPPLPEDYIPTAGEMLLWLVTAVCIYFAFAYDAYHEAKRVQ